MSKVQVIEGFRSIADDFDKIVDVDVAALVLMEGVDALSARAAEALILADKMGCFDGIETWDRVQATALPVFNAAAPKVISATPTASRLGDLLDNKRCRKAMYESGYGLFLVMRAAEKFAASEPGRIALPKDQQINVDPHRGRFRTIFCLPGISAPATYTWNEHIFRRDHLDWLRLHPNDDCELASFCELKKQQVGIFASLFRVLADLLDEEEPSDRVRKLAERIAPSARASHARPTETDVTDWDLRQPSRSPAMSLEQFGEALTMDARRFKTRAETEWDLQREGSSDQLWTVSYKNMDDSTMIRIERHARGLSKARTEKLKARAKKSRKRRAAK